MMKVCIDAGHGKNKQGNWTGAKSVYGLEDHYTYVWSQIFGKCFKLCDWEVIYTRENEYNIPLSARANIAVSNKCNLFLSIHFDASTHDSARGFSAYVALGDNVSTSLATSIIKSCEQVMPKIPCRGVKTDVQSHVGRLTVLRRTHFYMPAVLLECGFITSKNDMHLINDSKWRQDFIRQIVDNIERWYDDRGSQTDNK